MGGPAGTNPTGVGGIAYPSGAVVSLAGGTPVIIPLDPKWSYRFNHDSLNANGEEDLSIVMGRVYHSGGGVADGVPVYDGVGFTTVRGFTPAFHPWMVGLGLYFTGGGGPYEVISIEDNGYEAVIAGDASGEAEHAPFTCVSAAPDVASGDEKFVISAAEEAIIGPYHSAVILDSTGPLALTLVDIQSERFYGVTR